MGMFSRMEAEGRVFGEQRRAECLRTVADMLLEMLGNP